MCPPEWPAATLNGPASVGPGPLLAHAVGACCRRTRTRPHAHIVLRSRACPTPRPQRCDAICAGHVRHVRVRLLTACSFADGLRVSPPVQAAVAACGRAQWPPRPRHLRHDRQARRQHHGHEDPAAVTPRLFRLAQAARCLLAGRGRPGRLSTCLPQTSLCSSTLHTPHTHSLHRPPLTVRFHSNATCPSC